jgi:hypothetical protein
MLGSILASEAGIEELGSVSFLPGQAELSPRTEEIDSVGTKLER